MDSRQFLGLEPTHNPHRWVLPVVQGISTGGGFLFGGCGLGAAVAAMEGTSGRQAVWATAQYLSYAKPGEVMDIDVTLAVHGHQITQARAVCHVGDREILTVNAAFGDRDLEEHGQFEKMPLNVPQPFDCKERPHVLDWSGTISGRMDQRIVKGREELEELDGTPSDGQVLLWSRIPEVIEGVDAAALSILGDFVPMGVGQSLGIRGGGNSLDNTLRIGKLVPTEWVLLDIRIHMVERGFGHGLVHMFAEDGTLMATASQSCIIRFWRDMPGPGPSGKAKK
ncbi:MAG: thioesterase family protein [Actinomycetota bacterium]|nr:thioesterase family protein [Actinomycetota bacterium]MDA3018763.1 thioesterase family protein [Actinomycetota bacterium]